jgi:flagellar hook-associated protein 3 FlgL
MAFRVTTPGNYSVVLSNLLAAQQRQMDAGERVATQRNGTDLKDYARDAELLTGMRSLQDRLKVYQEQNGFIAEKLQAQDTNLKRIAEAAQSVRQVIAEALASDRVDTLIEDIDAQMRNAVEALNGRYGGKYLFAGGQVDTRPVTATTLTDLTAGPTIASFFQNDDFKVTARVDEATNITSGMLADEIGTDMLTAFQTMEAFHEGASGPFTGQMTAAQRTFLEGQLAVWEDVRMDVTTITARNGLLQKRVDTTSEDLTARQNTLAGMIGNITDADMAQAAAALQQAQLSVQSAAYVFQSLASASLINLLK